MAGVHPIMATLREKRIERGMTLSKLARVANLSRESIRKRESRKFQSGQRRMKCLRPYCLGHGRSRPTHRRILRKSKAESGVIESAGRWTLDRQLKRRLIRSE